MAVFIYSNSILLMRRFLDAAFVRRNILVPLQRQASWDRHSLLLNMPYSEREVYPLPVALQPCLW